MSTATARARVECARQELEQAERQLASRWQRWRELARRHRLALVLGGGLVSGFVLTAAPPRLWSRVGAALFGGGGWLLRSPFAPTLFGALWTKILCAPVRPDPPTPDAERPTPASA